MTFQSISPSDAVSSGGGPDAASTTRDPLAWECYCGLGPACPIFDQMTPQQQAACSLDKRRTAQSYYRNGIGW
jgi:hypothetical protein